MKNLIALAALLFAGAILTGCGEKAEESVAPDASAIQNAQPSTPKATPQGGSMPAPAASGLDPTK